MLQTERALTAWETGQKILPDGQAGWFSEDNWGDFFEYRDGAQHQVARTSQYARTIENFTISKWRHVIDEAFALHSKLQLSVRRKKTDSYSKMNGEAAGGTEKIVRAPEREMVSN